MSYMHDEYTIFLSTPSARRATYGWAIGARDYIISIHALREEGDLAGAGKMVAMWYFYPRPPRGGRHSAK